MIRRREFMSALGGAAAAWPFAARAQQRLMPVIAYVSTRSAESDRLMSAAFRRGLNEFGYEEGRNLAIEYRFAGGQYDRVPALVKEIIRARVRAIALVGIDNIDDQLLLEIRASRIPVLFNTGSDPVRQRFVESMNRPGGNLTGVNTLVGELTTKIVSLLHQLVPRAMTIGIIEDAAFSRVDDDARSAANALGVELVLLKAGSDAEIENRFAVMSERHIGVIHIPTSPYFVTRAKLFAALAAHFKLPAAYARREFADAGGLMSYGYDVADSYRELGRYAGRVLMGTSPADLPVFLPTKFEFVINLQTAKQLGLEVPPTLRALANEVIE
jgi:putative ABC transport system substrate-binding protein